MLSETNGYGGDMWPSGPNRDFDHLTIGGNISVELD